MRLVGGLTYRRQETDGVGTRGHDLFAIDIELLRSHGW